MNKKSMLRSAVLTVLTLLWMLLIFMMSGADDDESNAQSGTICTFLCETFIEGFEDLPLQEQRALEQSIAFPVRKCAHLTEYAVLGALLAATAAAYSVSFSGGSADNMAAEAAAGSSSSGGGAAAGSSFSGGVPEENIDLSPAGGGSAPAGSSAAAGRKTLLAPRYILPFFAGALYAVSDEVHQLYVPGRAGQPRDVLIDSVGVLIGIGVYSLAASRMGRKRYGR